MESRCTQGGEPWTRSLGIPRVVSQVHHGIPGRSVRVHHGMVRGVKRVVGLIKRVSVHPNGVSMRIQPLTGVRTDSRPYSTSWLP